MNTALKFFLLCIFFIFLSLSEANAFPRLGRVVEGVVQKINLHERTAEIETANGATFITWRNKTKIYQQGSEVPESSMRNGMWVKVTRYEPLFGPPHVSKILLMGSVKKNL